MEKTAVEIVGIAETDAGSTATMDWRPNDRATIRMLLVSDADGVSLRFGPTIDVAGWPAWLRGGAAFWPAGAQTVIWLDPSHEADPAAGAVRALDLRGRRTTTALADLAGAMAQALSDRCVQPSPLECQAIEVCAGLAFATAARDGIAPSPASQPGLFLPSTLPVVVDDINGGPLQQHVRLTYRLPRVDGYWTSGCSLRLFRGAGTFGIEFRALQGDHLPAMLRPACVLDDLGPVLRFTINRVDGTAEVVGDMGAAASLRLARAVARQVSGDLVRPDAPVPIGGFEAPCWRHWLAALPDLMLAALLAR